MSNLKFHNGVKLSSDGLYWVKLNKKVEGPLPKAGASRKAEIATFQEALAGSCNSWKLDEYVSLKVCKGFFLAKGIKLKPSTNTETITGAIKKGRLLLISVLSASMIINKTRSKVIIWTGKLPKSAIVIPITIEAISARGVPRIFVGFKICMYIIGSKIKLKAVTEKLLPEGLKAIFLAKARGK